MARARRRRTGRPLTAAPRVHAAAPAAGAAPRWWALRLLHPFPSLLVAGLTAALVPFADRYADAPLYVVLGLGMLLFQFAIGAANDAADASADLAAKPWKPIPAGIVSVRTATFVAAGCAGAGLVVTADLQLGAWLVGVAGLLCGLSYDLALKRTAFSWLPWSLAFPLVPTWVYLAADAWEPPLAWIFPLGVCLGLALYLANQAPDVESDRAAGVRGLAQILGQRRSLRLALGLFGAAASGACVVLLLAAPAQAALAAATALIVLLLVPRSTRLFGANGFFGLLAVSSAALALVFVSAV